MKPRHLSPDQINIFEAPREIIATATATPAEIMQVAATEQTRFEHMAMTGDRRNAQAEQAPSSDVVTEGLGLGRDYRTRKESHHYRRPHR